MLQDQKNYNTSEIIRKEKASTTNINNAEQVKEVKDARYEIAEQKKQWFKTEVAKKSQVTQMAKQNICLAQDKFSKQQYAKREGNLISSHPFRNK
jgi:ribosomal protein L1